MSEHGKELDSHTGTETTGHEWDGIKELNTPLPRWWLWTWYASMVYAVIFWILMPSWPGLPGAKGALPGMLGFTDRATVDRQVAEMRADRAAQGAVLMDASLVEIIDDENLLQFAMAMGESAFGDNCATCHGAGGRGAKGYPVLADDVWLWGGTLDEIEYTITHGIRSGTDLGHISEMPAFGAMDLLDGHEIDVLVEHIVALSDGEPGTLPTAASSELFEAQCSVCHGSDAKGDRTVGAPDLTDQDWLFGGGVEDIRATIYDARNATMPAWSERLDEPTIKALSVYVHSFGGGE